MRNILFIIYLSLSPILVGSVSAASDVDSLEQIVANLPAVSKLEKLDELASDKGNGLNYKYYADRLLEEAERQKNDTYKGNALFQIVRYYYSRNIDSMYLFMQKAEPIFLNYKRYDDLFRMKAWYIYALSNNGETDSVISAVESLKALSAKFDYPNGIDMANQALADFYFATGLTKEGIALYEDVLRAMEERDAPLAKRFTIVRHLLNEVTKRV